MLSFLRKDCGIPQVKNVALHHEGGAWRTMAIQFQDLAGKRTPPSVVWQALFACLGKHPDYPKILFAVDDDIDPHDYSSLMWAMCFRFQPHRDMKVIQGRTAQLDQSAMPNDPESGYSPSWIENNAGPGGASAVLIDATRKWDYTPVSLPTRPYMERARELWDELGFPELRPRSPWFGYDLGAWPERFKRMAELGEKGAFEEIAADIIARGREV